jgi:F0F1-type ATP synthase membrane subunit c/vacuolar-type H+-ATPase subunit K
MAGSLVTLISTAAGNAAHSAAKAVLKTEKAVKNIRIRIFMTL